MAVEVASGREDLVAPVDQQTGPAVVDDEVGRVVLHSITCADLDRALRLGAGGGEDQLNDAVLAVLRVEAGLRGVERRERPARVDQRCVLVAQDVLDGLLDAPVPAWVEPLDMHRLQVLDPHQGVALAGAHRRVRREPWTSLSSWAATALTSAATDPICEACLALRRLSTCVVRSSAARRSLMPWTPSARWIRPWPFIGPGLVDVRALRLLGVMTKAASGRNLLPSRHRVLLRGRCDAFSGPARPESPRRWSSSRLGR